MKADIAAVEQFPSDTNLPNNWTVLIAIVLAYVCAFIAFSGGNGILFDRPPSWTQWFDQGEYWRSALAFARGDLSPSEHWYPPLYSLLLAPLTSLGPAPAALLLNLALYLTCYFGFERIARYFGLKRLYALPLFLASTLLLPGVGKTWVEPWNTTLSAALLWAALAMSANVIIGKQTRIRNLEMLMLGAILALIPCARPTDAVMSALFGAAIASHLIFARKEMHSLIILIAGGLAVVIPYGALYLAIWGPAASTYANLGSAIGFNFAWLGWKAYLIMVEPRPWFPDGIGMLKVMPWLVLGGAGALAALATAERRVLAFLLLVPALVYFALMLAFVDLLPSGLWRFNNIHYFKWTMPLFALFAWQFVAGARSRPALSALSLSFLVLITSFRIEPSPAQSLQPARLLIYRSEKIPYEYIYMGKTNIIDNSGIQRNIFEYHQIYNNHDLVYVEALRRDFTGNERISASDDISDFPAAANGFYVDGDEGIEALGQLLGRFQPHVSFGLPCWLPLYRCPMKLPIPTHARAQS